MVRLLACLAASLGPCLAALGPAGAQTRTMPVPTITIYPGETIKDALLVEREFAGEASALPVIDHRQALVGKVARRTLLPGQLIPANGVEEAKLVLRGNTTQIVFSEKGLTIVTLGSALQSGGLGEQIRARNIDSGLTVVGTVQADGSLRVAAP